ncbi:MAG: HAMP domain-containing histidine kinase [Chitinophagales bacterium]|nr:HAMP domain-containing histidine kinase [Chitinophagales bacterium]
MELLQRFQQWQQRKESINTPAMHLLSPWQRVLLFLRQIKSTGFTDELEAYEKRKLGIFNLLNFFQLITGVLIPVIDFLTISSLPVSVWAVAMLPALVSLTALILNAKFRYKAALLVYFILYPVFTCIIYINGINLGVELSFVLYGLLSVFFLQEIGYMLFSVGLSMISYFILSVVLKDYRYQLKSIHLVAYLVNQLLAIGYIFYGFYLIKRENAGYQSSIIRQKAAMERQTAQLKKQAAELEELNTLKNKLFSVISHDLKTPMYALRNLFHNAQELNMSASEIKAMLPDVINDLNYTTGLMENLLHWAKSQMQSNEVRKQELDMNNMTEDVIRLLRVQADAKQITIERKMALPAYALADRDMINLVLRNLLSNAIKFSPREGRIVIGIQAYESFTEVFIRDSGSGITKEAMQKINENNFYSTPGTASEAGTGLGLMLCREFLQRNHGNMMIESEPGRGSTFSFTLPQP